MKGVKMFQITKRFTGGLLAGLTITEAMPFQMAVGSYPGILGSSPFDVTSCEKVGA